MPINEPIKNRKVAPASLAFEGQETSGTVVYQVGQVPTQPSYQEIINNYNFNFSLTLVTNQVLEANTDKLMTAIKQAEHRAKHNVGDYKHVLQWDLQQSQAYILGAGSTNIAYNREIIRTVGARSYGNPMDTTARWYFTCPHDAEGAWWFYAHLNIRHTNTDQIREGHLLFMINDQFWRVVDQVDSNMMGENLIIDMRLQGGCHVPLQAGDRFSVHYWPITNTQTGYNIAMHPTSVYAYITGHRETCSGFEPLNTRDTGLSYSFDHNA